MKTIRNIVIGLLDKLDAPHTDKISTERALKKLHRYVAKNGCPAELNDKEVELLEEQGLLKEKPPKPKSAEKKSKPAKKKSSKPNAKKKARDPKPRLKRVTWIECATEAVLESKTISEAVEKTVARFKEATNKQNFEREIPKSRLQVSYVLKVLVLVGKIEIDGDDIKHI